MLKLFQYDCLYNDPASVFAAFDMDRYAVFLDSSDTTHPLGRRSVIAFDPEEIIETNRGEAGRHEPEQEQEQEQELGEEDFTRLKKRVLYWREKMTMTAEQEKWTHFCGGAIGLFGYDLGWQLEKRPLRTSPQAGCENIPDMCVGIYLHCLVFDHDEKTSVFYIWAENQKRADKKFDIVRDKITLPAQLKEHNQRSSSPLPDNVRIDERLNDKVPETQAQEEEAKSDEGDFCRKAQRVIDYIFQGDIFQANLSRRITGEFDGDGCVYDHYLALRKLNAAPYGVFFNHGKFQLASTSPEQFLCIKGRDIETRPIKGTCARHLDNEDEDESRRHCLMRSEKDRAENVMIVDLMRNDLSKVCIANSIEVPILCQVETYACVHHMVSVVKGILREGVHAIDALKACFPGGSISGAPKVRAMEIIDEMESYKRGPYTGAFGYIGFNGCMDTNILIRTIVYAGDRLWFNVGCGIVADSRPAQEYEETRVKARGIVQSLVTGDTYEHET